MPIVGPPSGKKREYSRAEKSMLVRTGLQFLSEALLPKFLNNFMGRWIVWKLIAFLVDNKLVKPQVFKDLKKPLGNSKYRNTFLDSARQASTNEMDEIIALCQRELNAEVEDTMDFAAVEAELKNYLCKIWKGQKCADVIKDAFRGLRMTACTDVRPVVMIAAIRAALEDKNDKVTDGTKLAAKIFCPYLQRVLEEPMGYHVEKSAELVGYDTPELIRALSKDSDPLDHFANLTPGRRKRVLIAILCGAKMHADSLPISHSQFGFDLDELADQIEAVGFTEASGLVDAARTLVTTAKPTSHATDDPGQVEESRQDWDYFDIGRGRNQPPRAVKRNPADNPTIDHDSDINSPAYEGYDLHEDANMSRPPQGRNDGRNADQDAEALQLLSGSYFEGQNWKSLKLAWVEIISLVIELQKIIPFIKFMGGLAVATSFFIFSFGPGIVKILFTILKEVHKVYKIARGEGEDRVRAKMEDKALAELEKMNRKDRQKMMDVLKLREMQHKMKEIGVDLKTINKVRELARRNPPTLRERVTDLKDRAVELKDRTKRRFLDHSQEQSLKKKLQKLLKGGMDPVLRRQLIMQGPDSPWSDEFLEKVRDRMEGIYEPHIEISVDEKTQLRSLDDEVFASIKIGYAKNWPSVGQYPKQLNEMAKPIWDEVISAYSDKIKQVARPFSSGEGKKFNADEVAWAYAIILFKRVCAQRQIRPFKSGNNPRVTPGGGTSKEPNRDLVRGMLEELGKQAKLEVQRNFETLKRAKMGKRLHKPKYHDAGRTQGRFYVTLVYTFSAGTEFTIKGMLNELGRKDKYHKMHNSTMGFKRLNGRIDIKAMLNPHGFYVTMYLNGQEAEAMMQIDSGDVTKMTKALKELAKDWAKAGKIKRRK